jgi:predicted nuclease of predicted toxin-antitoxin system
VRFLLDHDVPADAAHPLLHWGHDVVSLRQALPVTASDDEVFRHAREERRIIISCNRAHF